MPLYDDILVDGASIVGGLPADIEAGACLEGPWDWPFISPDQRGDFPVFQGYDGVGYTDQPYNTAILPLYLALNAPACEDGEPTEQSDETWAWINDAIEQVRLLCKADQEVVLTRRRSMPGAVNESQTTAGKLLRITTSRPGRDSLRLVIEFLQLQGLWYGGVEVQALVAGTTTFTPPGTTRTHRMVIRIPGGVNAPVVQNDTNGYMVMYDAVTPAGGIDIDVLARTATAVTGGADVSRFLIWSKVHLMRLDPQSQAVKCLPSTGTLTYYPAYL